MNKDRYIWFYGEKIYVNEEIYRAYYRPMWREKKRAKVRMEKERSLEAFIDSGFEIPSKEMPSDELVMDKLLLDELFAALAELTAAEQSLVAAIYFDEKPQRNIVEELGVSRTTLVYRRKKILNKLRRILEKNK